MHILEYLVSGLGSVMCQGLTVNPLAKSFLKFLLNSGDIG